MARLSIYIQVEIAGIGSFLHAFLDIVNGFVYLNCTITKIAIAFCRLFGIDWKYQNKLVCIIIKKTNYMETKKKKTVRKKNNFFDSFCTILMITCEFLYLAITKFLQAVQNAYIRSFGLTSKEKIIKRMFLRQQSKECGYNCQQILLIMEWADYFRTYYSNGPNYRTLPVKMRDPFHLNQLRAEFASRANQWQEIAAICRSTLCWNI